MDDTGLSQGLSEAVRNIGVWLRATVPNTNQTFAQQEAALLAAVVLDELADDVDRTRSFCADMYLRMREPKI